MNFKSETTEKYRPNVLVKVATLNHFKGGTWYQFKALSNSNGTITFIPI